MFRKHICSSNILEVKNQPFYAWQCITINGKGFDIDLVIPNENCMNMLLKLLINRTYTLDGMRDSNRAIRKLLIKAKVE